MNHVHSVTFFHRYIVPVDNKFRKTYLLWKRGQSISTETVMQFTEEHANKRFQAHRFLYCGINNSHLGWRMEGGSVTYKFQSEHLQLPMQSVHITTDVVSSNRAQGEVYNIMW